MSETRQQRERRVRHWSNDRERCLICGRRRINVAHEPDPVNAPEGVAYFTSIASQMHAFVPSGEYDRG